MDRIGADVVFVGNVVLNQEKKDVRMDRILLILTSFLSWFRTNLPSSPRSEKLTFLSWYSEQTYLPFLLQNKLTSLSSFRKTFLPFLIQDKLSFPSNQLKKISPISSKAKDQKARRLIGALL